MSSLLPYIRGAQPEDKEAVMRIWRQAQGWLGNGGLAWKRFWDGSGDEWIVMEAGQGGRILGFAHYRRRRDGWQTLYEIAVDDAMKKCGYGRILLQAIPCPIRLKTNWDNAESNAFYRAMGFRPAGKVQSLKGKTMNVWERHEPWE